MREVSRLERALAEAIAELEELKRQGIITGYDRRPFLEDGIYHLVAYAKKPNEVNRVLGNLSTRLSLEFGLPLYILSAPH